MVRQSLYALLLLLLALTQACLGGQTGQPDSLTCGPTELAAASAWRGFTTRQLGESFEGTHSALLHWVKEPRASSQRTPVVFEDSVSLTIDYPGGAGMLVDCGAHLDMPVAVGVATTASGISEHGIASLSFTTTTRPLHATLNFDGAVVSVTGSLLEIEAATAPEGELETSAEDAPGGWATFAGTTSP